MPYTTRSSMMEQCHILQFLLVKFSTLMQCAVIPITDLEPNVEYRLGLMIYNGIITHSS